MPRVDLTGAQSDEYTSGPSRSNEEGGKRVWSSHQKAVFDAVLDPKGGSLRVDAVAGSGKTTTLVHASSLMTGQVAFLAFNKRIADEIKEKVRGQRNVNPGTMHSYGLRAWKGTAPNARVDGDKLEAIMEDLHVPFELRSVTKFMVSGAKQAGWKFPVDRVLLEAYADHHDALDKLPERYHEDGSLDPYEWINPVLKESVARSFDVIDFDDMIFMPLMYGFITPEYDWVLVDEAQDTNNVRRQLARRLLAPGGRVVVVGDPHQAIYGFTGADADAMDLITEEFGCRLLPLTTTYRCPRRIVEHAQKWVSHIQAASSAPEGNLSEMDMEQFVGHTPGPQDVILCRYTRPLVQECLGLLRRGTGARIEGRDIGQSLIALTRRWRSIRSVGDLLDKLDRYVDVETQKLRARGQKGKAQTLEDKVGCIRAIAEGVSPGDAPESLANKIQSMFGDTPPGQTPRVVTLSTVHKAKGREWNKVYILGRAQMMPSRFAKMDWEQEQEKNLIYVAVTRSKDTLIEVAREY